MTIAFTCPHCQATTQIDESYAGQSGPCAQCGATVTVPLRGATASAGRSSSMGTIVVLVVAVGGVLGIGLCAAALLLPAVQPNRPAAVGSQCKNNLKQIGLALHNYHHTYGTFPSAYLADDTGQPMHSWRVLILPFLEQAAVYDQYDFDQPWDSPANQAVCNFPLDVYQCPADGSSPCNYFLVSVPDGMFDADKATRMAAITDGTSNTIMVVEVTGAGVHWSEPSDLGPAALTAGINSAADGTTISSVHTGGAHVLFGDGHVRFLPESVTTQLLQALVTKSDGQVVEIP